MFNQQQNVHSYNQGQGRHRRNEHEIQKDVWMLQSCKKTHE